MKESDDMSELKSFECVYGNKDKDGNLYMTIDGYPDNEHASGNTVAAVYLTPHGDFVTHFNPLDSGDYTENNVVKELIEQAKKDLLAASHKSITEQIDDIRRDKDVVFGIDEADIDVVVYNKDKAVVQMALDLDTDKEILALFAEEALPEWRKEEILKMGYSSIADAINDGAYGCDVYFDYHTDRYTDELTLENAKKKNDKTLCDCVVVKVYEDFSAPFYSFTPDNQQWYRDFVNKELAKYGKPTAREMIEDALKKKREKTYDKE